jgi:hypothetical protein
VPPLSAQSPAPPPPAPTFGAAALTRAQGDLLVRQQQARILQQQANQASLATQKQAFDLQNYERALTPTLNDQLEYDQAQLVRRILYSASPADITSGVAENTLLPYLNSLISQGLTLPPVYFDPAVPRQLNLTTGDGAKVGPLRDVGHLAWPLALRGPAQERLDGLLSQAVAATIHGTLTWAQYQQVRSGLADLQSELENRAHNNQLDATSYRASQAFLQELRGAVDGLQGPSAGKLLGGTYAVTGWSVGEVVQSMTSQGLQFAPALPGQEPAYRALHSAMVSYAAEALGHYGP